ncbi:Transposase IS66 family protein, partial [Paraburkholderia terricola]
MTPAPPRIIPRGLLSESALAWIATGKYQFGMPLYRQAGLLRRFGGDISSNTIAASMVRVGLATQPVINLVRDVLLDTELIYCDETTLQVLKEEGRRAQTKSYLWAQMTDSGVLIRCFTYTPGRGAKLGDKLFTGIRAGAVMMTDGYEPYNDIAERHQLVHLGCWVHVRRYFVKAEDSVPKAARTPHLLATRFIKLIGKLFAAEARRETWSASRRQRLRRRYSARVLAAIHTLMVEQSPGVTPKSLLGKGLTYLRSQWPKLIRYVENGDWPISNNVIHAASGMNDVMPTPRLCRVMNPRTQRLADLYSRSLRLSALSESLQEGEQRIWRFVACRCKTTRRRVRERAFLELHVGVQIDLSSLGGLVTEPERDHGQVDAVMHQAHRG